MFRVIRSNLSIWKNFRSPLNRFILCKQSLYTSSKLYKTEDGETDAPYRYSTSQASKWNARKSNRNEEDNDPEIQSIVVVASMAVFFIYFFILREENDIDQLFDRNIFEIRPDVEMSTLKVAINNCKERKTDSSAMEKRLAELEKMHPEYLK